MIRPLTKILAVLLAIWLPLFSGSAMAASVVMQINVGDCHPKVVQFDEHEGHLALAGFLQDHSPVSPDQGGMQHDQQDSSCKNCGVCHFACSVFLANVADNLVEAQTLSQRYSLSSAQFQSFTPILLDPPPLARV